MLAFVSLVAAGACSSPAPRSAPEPRATLPVGTTSPPTTAPVASTTTTSTTPPTRVKPVPGSTDTTPPPVLHATGTDYPAIAASLFRYRTWLLAHHPDPELAREAIAPGTLEYGEAIAQLGALGAARHTLVSVDQQLEFTTSSVQESLMTLILHEVIREERVLDQQGRIVKTTHFEYPNRYFVLMTNDGRGRWRLADITDLQPEPSIPL